MRSRIGIGSAAGCLVLAALLVLATGAASQVFEGALSANDLVHPADGSYYKTVELDLQAGDVLVLDLMSRDFDAFLTVHSPSGRIIHDDDSGEGFNARIVVDVDQGGKWIVFINTAGRGETGRYTLRALSVPGHQVERQEFAGRLADDGPRLPTNNAVYSERVLDLRAGQLLVIDLESSDFDAMLFVHSPGGQTFEDDDGGEGFNSRLFIEVDRDGPWRFVATSYDPSSRGAYRMIVRALPKPD